MKRVIERIQNYTQNFSKENRLYILPTFNGAKLFFLSLILLFTGLIYTNNFILFFNFLLFSLFICSMFYTHFNLGQLKILSLSIESSYADHSGNLKFSLSNESSFPRYNIKVVFPKNKAYQVDDILIPKMEGHSLLELSKEIKLKVRGVHELNRVMLSTTFPFSFFRTFTYFHKKLKFYIYPKPKNFAYDLNSIDSQDLDPDDSSLNLKPFRPGDSFRHIHWKKFALNQTLLVKEIEDDRGQDLLVEGDKLVGGFGLEDQLSTLAYLVSELMTKGFTFGLRYRDYNFEPSRDKDHLKRILEKLSVVK